MRTLETGKLIVLHGVNRSGKTTQCNLLVERIQQYEKKAMYIKYPVYTMEPTGPWINDYFREGNPYGFSPREMQLLNVINRRDSNIPLMRHLLDGVHVVAESYASGGTVWGMAEGIDREFLEQLNTGSAVHKPDIEILLEGNSFVTGKEHGHKHEEKEELQRRVRETYLQYAREHHWPIVDAARPGKESEIHDEIWYLVRPLIL